MGKYSNPEELKCRWVAPFVCDPYCDRDGRNRVDGDENRVVRGGSWRDRPAQATSAVRQSYRPYQGVFNVGFRVVIAVDHARASE